VIEAALAGYDGALLVASHDETFLDAIRIERRIDLGQSET
jgi:ATPase subunit of ABC transporter with duplicated ATPase domains